MISYADRATFSLAGAAAAKELSIDPVAMGWILSAFAWPMSPRRFRVVRCSIGSGRRKIYVIALVLWSIFTFVQAFAGAVRGRGGDRAVRDALHGRVAEPPAFPANARIVAAWFPTSERGTASAIFNAAQYFALVSFAPLMGWLVHGFGWRSVFVVMGVVGLVAAAIFARYVQSPLEHPGINQAELDYIEQGGALVNIEW